MSQEIMQWKRVLDVPMEQYLEKDLPDSEQEQIQETYDGIFRHIIEQGKLLNLYRQDYMSVKGSNERLHDILQHTREELESVIRLNSSEHATNKVHKLLSDIQIYS